MAADGHVRLLPILTATVLSLAAAACADSDTLPESPCELPAFGDAERGDSIVVRDTDAPCTIEFHEVARLQGPEGGPDPALPVVPGPGGRYLTDTYSRGEIAIWSSRGEFERTIGLGAGSGPGEFGFVSSLVVDMDSVIHAFPGMPHWHRYAWSGDYLETVRVPNGSSTTGMIMTGDGTLIAPALGDPEAPFLVWRRGADEIEVVDSPSSITSGSPAFPSSSASMGIWSVDMERYVIRRHDPTDLGIDALIVREVDWFPGPRDGNPARVSPRFTVDDRGLLWTLVTVPVADAPPGGRPPAASIEEYRAMASRDLNMMIEVLTVTGRLLASRTYEELGEIPRPITAERWYVEESVPVPSIVILEPRLVQR